MLNDQAILEQIERQPNRTAGYERLIQELSLRGNAATELEERLQSLVGQAKADRSRSQLYAEPGTRTARQTSSPAAHHASRRLRLRHTRLWPAHEDRGRLFHPATGDRACHARSQVLVRACPRAGRGQARRTEPPRAQSSVNPTMIGIFHHGRATITSRRSMKRLRRRWPFPRRMERPAGAEGQAEESTGPLLVGRDELLPQKTLIRDHVYTEQFRRRRSSRHGRPRGRCRGHRVAGAAQNPRGRAVEISARRRFSVDVEIVIRKHHLPHRFPVRSYRRRGSSSPSSPARNSGTSGYRRPAHRHHRWRTARDFDDAVSVAVPRMETRNPGRHSRRRAYVREGRRSTWKPGCAGHWNIFPTTPFQCSIELTTDLCSLGPQVERLVLSCAMEIDHQGEIVRFKLNKA